MKKFVSVVFLSILITTIGCKDDDNGRVAPDFNRQQMLQHLADQVIMPAYDSLNLEVEKMDGAIHSFAEAPSTETLAQARSRFVKAYYAWERAAFWEFGPAFDVLLMSSVNSFPADNPNIDNNIASGTYDFNTTLGQDEKGFPALDYLLYGLADTDEGTVGLFSTDANAQNRKDYLLAVVEDITTRVQQVVNGWAASDGNYRQTFTENDGTNVGSSIGLMVNELNKFVEGELRNGKIGIPLGKLSQDVAIPANVEAGYSDISIALASENLDALYDFYMGRGATVDGESFYQYLKAIDAQYNGGLLADVIKEQFELAIKAVAEIPSPYDVTVADNPEPADKAYSELQKLVILLKADMPSALGVLVTYQDNDGD